MSLMLGIAAASAATPFFDHGLVLEAPSEGPFAEGINAPTVIYDPAEARYHLYFEHPGGEDDIPGRCGVYGRIGHAWSDDGLSWAFTEAPVLTPLEDSYYSCGVSQPAVLQVDGTWHMWFKADADPPEDGATNEHRGIGHATSDDGLYWTVEGEPLIEPFVDEDGAISTVGVPSAVLLEGVITLFYVQVPDIWVATSADGGETWSFGGEPAIAAGQLGAWSDVVITGPSAVCRDADDGTATTELLVGGKEDVDGSRLLTLALSVQEEGAAWSSEDTVVLLTQGTNWDPSWSHWDVINTDDGALVYYSRDADDGRKAVGLASTAEGWGAPLARACAVPAVDTGDTGDTGGPTDSVDTADSGPTGDSGSDSAPTQDSDPGVDESAGSGEDGCGSGGCGCASGSNPVAPWSVLGLLGLVAWRRRSDP